jgi:hypothetical protein
MKFLKLVIEDEIDLKKSRGEIEECLEKVHKLSKIDDGYKYLSRHEIKRGCRKQCQEQINTRSVSSFCESGKGAQAPEELRDIFWDLSVSFLFNHGGLWENGNV